MGATGMLAKSVEVAKACRAVGAKVRARVSAESAVPLLLAARPPRCARDSACGAPTACRRMPRAGDARGDHLQRGRLGQPEQVARYPQGLLRRQGVPS
eukprot:1617531-Prymnesium_polylepis.1